MNTPVIYLKDKYGDVLRIRMVREGSGQEYAEYNITEACHRGERKQSLDYDSCHGPEYYILKGYKLSNEAEFKAAREQVRLALEREDRACAGYDFAELELPGLCA